jgi:hypothetical protein
MDFEACSVSSSKNRKKIFAQGFLNNGWLRRPGQRANRWAHILVTLLLGAWASGAQAWGAEGHQVVAHIAEAYLSPQARTAIDRLLAQEPGQTLVSISTWADTHKNRQTAAWHYINLPKGQCVYPRRLLHWIAPWHWLQHI